jgi:hypothetical protein
MAYTTLVSGTTITAAWANASVRDQTIVPFASGSARDSAIAGPIEGQVSALQDVNTLTVYSGAAWSSIGPVWGALKSWTPTWTQGVTITATVNQATYSRVGRLVVAFMRLDATSAGTASSVILWNLPVNAALPTGVIGSVTVYDASGALFYVGSAYLQSGSTFGLVVHGTSGPATGLVSGAAVATGDVAFVQITYEAGADA